MDTTLRTTSTSAALGSLSGANAHSAALAVRAQSNLEPASRTAAAVTTSAAASSRSVTHRTRLQWDNQLQSTVASAQQAQDYLDQVASELEAVKAALSAKLAGFKSGARELEVRARQLSATIATRADQSGGVVDAQLDFSSPGPASQRFRITGLDTGMLQAGAPMTIAFSVGNVGGSQLAARIEADMTPPQLAARLDRALAPVQVRVALDQEGRIEFTTAEENWPAVRDSIAISGRGRVATEGVVSEVQLQDLGGATPDALRESLREVVQALERVRRSQAAASAALSAATLRAAQSVINTAELSASAQDFALTASNQDYASRLEISAALAGVSRDRVLALLSRR